MSTSQIISFWAAGTYFQLLYVTCTLSWVAIPQYILNFFLQGPLTFPVAGSTWTTGLSTPASLVANDFNHVAFLVFYDEDGEVVADSRGGGGELGGLTMCLLKKQH